jgi:hypothetical protein
MALDSAHHTHPQPRWWLATAAVRRRRTSSPAKRDSTLRRAVVTLSTTPSIPLDARTRAVVAEDEVLVTPAEQNP